MFIFLFAHTALFYNKRYKAEDLNSSVKHSHEREREEKKVWSKLYVLKCLKEMLFWAIWFLSWPSKCSKAATYRRARWRMLPCLTRARSSGAHNAEHSKSTAIIIRAVPLWTLMAVPVLLPRHIQRAHVRLEGVNTWINSREMDSPFPFLL